ncbi:hypothetical protein GOPIP_043_00350 [Gordonia polyisoprenivorans NBRC 16320 = JCM 10675]|uniref:Tryptophan-rich sensory protein n=3 Tax=Gordonia polyisoprenivorans TaxID=84595 RepID=A0A846WS45_9ACTN|nr:tryptophan-rich sensory protein [Gordonia polyisoprenivorans]NKY04508.1 tryptophan-rich sensory protein [Gordonia polyisoprenivorans]GAB23259.1 hypothetical protein GOPIP_043_00350 [Gordonia polyisoprenivorans NBRC 16320 = JCM 10675]
MIHREPLVVTGAFRASAWRGEHAPLTVLTTSVATTAAAAIGSLTTGRSVTTCSNGRDAEARALVGALGVNLVLNAGWSVVFFGAHRLGPDTGGFGIRG